MTRLYHPFPLKCIDILKQESLEYIAQFNEERVYMKPILFSNTTADILTKELKSYGLQGYFSPLIFKRKDCYDMVECHIDYSPRVDDIVHGSIVIPLEGCTDTVMYWLTGDYDYSVVTSSYDSRALYAKIEWNSQPTAQFVEISDQPMLTKVDVPHGATSRSDGSYRIVLTLRVLGNPEFEDIIKTRFGEQ